MKISVVIAAILLFCLGVNDLSAQTIKSISGKVVNTRNEPLMGNVLLLSAKDSTLVRAINFIEGTIKLTEVNRVEVLVKLTSLLFADTLIKVSYKGDVDVDLGTLIIGETSNQLREVVVKSQAPLTKLSANGNMEVNVENTVLAGSSSVNEILARSPNITISDGQISVLGKGEALIYLNGKMINIERLSAIPASQIAKIEIIANPTAKYDAEGKAVINIITKVNTTEGLMGSLIEQITVSDFSGSNTNTSVDLNYSKDKLALAGNYGLLLGQGRELLHTIRTRPKPEEYMQSDLTTDWQRRFTNYSNYGLGVQYTFSSKSNVSLAYSGNMEKLGGNVNSANDIATNSSINAYKSIIDKDEVRANTSLSLNYNLTTDTIGSAVFVGTQYANYKSDINDFISEDNMVNNASAVRYLKNYVDHDLAVFSAQADYVKKFSEDKKLEAGVKYSYVNTSSGTDFLVATKPNADFKLDEDLSSKFKYVEKLAAAYVNYSSPIWKKFSFTIGIRAENTTYELNTTAGNDRVINDNYLNLFPNLSLNMMVSDKLKLRTSYVARITRPRYQALNPFVIYQDPFTSIEGNPNLIPEKVHAFELGAIYNRFDFKIGYTYKLDPLTAAALRGNGPNNYVLKGINLEKEHYWFTSLSRSFETKWWTSTNTINISYRKSIDNTYSFAANKSSPQLYFYSSNTFNVNDLFNIQLLAWYLGDRYYGLGYERNRSLLTLGIEKTFFKKSLKISATLNDILNGFIASGNYEVGQTEIYYHRTYTSSYSRLMATYRFGKLKKSNYRNTETGRSENSRAN